MSYRARLLLFVAVLAASALLSAGTAWWSAREARELQREMRLAEDVLALHLALRADASDLFKQFADAVLFGDRDRGSGEALLRTAIDRDLDAIRAAIAGEVSQRGSEEIDELNRLALIERELAAIEAEYKRLLNLRASDGEVAARNRLADLFDRRMDGSLRSLIDAAIAEERSEVDASVAASEALAWRTALVAYGATAFTLAASLVAVTVLLRGVDAPLAALVTGTRALRQGRLDHRIRLRRQDEFGELAASFDVMAAEIEAMQAQASEAREGLLGEVEARTRELRHANERLAAKDTERRQFLADISHELRTPLTVLRGEAELALRAGGERLDAGARGALATALAEADHMTRLVDDLLFVARREAGEARLALRPTPLAPILRGLVQDTTLLAAEQGLTIELDPVPDSATVEGDRGRLRQLFLVLIDNAISNGRRGGTVRVACLPAPGGLTVVVEDDGIGIPESDLPHVFERFRRGSNAAAGGSGLGLPIARAIAEAHGGSVTLESEEGRGTRASVFLPLQRKLQAVA